MQATSFDPKRRSDVLPGMYVHILTDNQEQLEGIVKKRRERWTITLKASKLYYQEKTV
ncbi:MAG: hypothetical protein HOD60_05180 [Candidatus Nitrosopelagicus sp.]|nr:hypothetical protein [Candidatus Nitrosopelagicus sp.]